jgi:hypothetical protein
MTTPPPKNLKERTPSPYKFKIFKELLEINFAKNAKIGLKMVKFVDFLLNS